ncbi:MAG: hypothetical protein ACP5Q5_10755 [Brevinematia bacterium]
MDERIKLLEKNGAKILFCDISSLDEDSILEYHNKMLQMGLDMKIRLFVIDIRDTYTTPKISESSKNLGKTLDEKNGKSFVALIGVTGIKKVIANAISKDMYFANDLDDAVNWLIKNYNQIK